MVGGVVTVSCDSIKISSAGAFLTLGTLPEAMRPSRGSALGTAYARGMDCYGQITVNKDGKVDVWCSVKSSGYFAGCVSYPAK